LAVAALLRHPLRPLLAAAAASAALAAGRGSPGAADVALALWLALLSGLVGKGAPLGRPRHFALAGALMTASSLAAPMAERAWTGPSRTGNANFLLATGLCLSAGCSLLYWQQLAHAGH